MEKRFTKPAPVLDERGMPNAGWASSGLLRYDRKAIRAPFYRIKEWDWYQVSDHRRALQFTYGHASYAGQVGVMYFDFERSEQLFVKDIILALPFSRLGLGASAEEDGALVYDKKGMYMRLEKQGKVRRLVCRCNGLEAEMEMRCKTPHSLVINVPFDESATAFYYNHKINCMAAEGCVTTAEGTYAFQEDAWGLLDWGRGVWPFHNEWYWSNVAGELDGNIFGFNLGCGFGNTSTATENALFYKEDIHKLGPVRFELGKEYNDPWRLVDEEGRLDLKMEPMYDRETQIKLLWVDNCTHQMFGRFSGRAVLDGGRVLHVENITGFAEHAVNNW